MDDQTERTIIIRQPKATHFAFLVGISGTDQLSFPDGTFALRGKDTSIGRDKDNHLVVSNSHGSISRRHTRIQFNEEENCYLIHDLATENGTYVNNESIQKAVLQDNDAIRLGTDVELIFKRAW